MSRGLREWESLYKRLSEDIFFFADLMGFNPTWQQRQILQAVQDGYPRIAVKSGQGPGKTACSVCIGLWRSLRAFRGQTIITAPTMRQCRDVWLKEARVWLAKANPMLQHFIEITKSKVEIGKDTDWGVVTVTATKEENAQGYHQDNLTVIAEEASGVPREIITQFKGTLSNPDSLFLMIGNPNTRDCSFFDCFNRQRHKWKCITLNAEDTARDYPHIVNPQRNLDLAEEFGNDSDVYRVRVLGEFPHTDPNTVLSSEEVEACTGAPDMMYKFVNCQRPKECGGGKAKQFGIDFSRFGGDESVIYRRTGNAIVEWCKFTHTEPLHIVNKAFEMQSSAGWKDADTVFVPDANGMGEGMMVNFYNAGKNVVEFKNQGCAVDDQYDNIITEAWFLFRRLARNKNCYIPNDNQLIQQLCGRRYEITNKGKIKIESKDEYMKRNENISPDRAEALVMAFYDQVNAVGNFASQEAATKIVGARIAGAA